MSKKHIATISPNKPVSEMTEAEIHKLAEEIANLVTPRLKASIEEQNKNS
jgi:ribosomal protein S13